ncbi:cytochrome P450 [Truncatella angustata]|uniref:Cytochrome P450 n=1 Tax=Truncatella angustata TaxID=152316 RepID=A0A9P8ZU63_9PEZI|nr:cytochrome P450 [Truncatella angustata]KAH6648936.1 cytochrome P450 [Truncatella angustata]
MTSNVGVQTPSVAIGNNLSYYLIIATTLFLVWFFQPDKSNGVSAPFYKASRMKWMFSADSLVRDSYNKFRDQVYQIKATEGVRTLIPANLVGELKGLPEEVLSASVAISEAMLVEYTKFTFGNHADTMHLLLKGKLTQQLGRLVPRLKSELEYIERTEFEECKDWTPMTIQPFILRAVSRLSGSVFVGAELGRTEEWMDLSINYAVRAFMVVIKLQFFPTWIRPIAKYLVSELKQIDRDVAKATELLKPIIDERLQDEELDPSGERPDDFVQWLLDALPEEQKRDYCMQAKLHLILCAAAIHTTSNLATDCIYDLATYPEHQEVLRKEAHDILEDGDGWTRKESMAKLKKMDSFIKESQRLAGNVTSFIRKVVKPIDLSDGTHLPSGTNLLAPQIGFSHDERYFPAPDVFDGLRFWKMRQQSDEAANRWQFTSIDNHNINFGLGKHACPGRFFAGNEIKVILSHLVLNYDIKLEDGKGRPEPTMFMMSKIANSKAEILFKRRTVA